MKKLTLSEQDFVKIRELDLLYVDKTRQMFEMLEYGNALFLSRPRRFGKSLLISTLEALFLGKKELFKGLWIEDKWDWEPRPVIRIDMSNLTLDDGLEAFKIDLEKRLSLYAEDFGLKLAGISLKGNFGTLLEEIYKKTGKRVVILIDEYDKPITEHLSNPEKAEQFRTALKNFYEALKSWSGNIHFLFITGITKLAKVSIFSVVNQLIDISMQPEFDDIAGITHQEMTDNFEDYLFALENRTGTPRSELLERIKYWYNGYSWGGRIYIYNPYSLLGLFRTLTFDDHWFETGTPGFLIDLIQKKYSLEVSTPPLFEEFEAVKMAKRSFDSHNLTDIDLKVLLFQTGYLTVSSAVNTDNGTNYTLNFPNHEVRVAFSGYILRAFINKDPNLNIQTKAMLLRLSLDNANETEFNTLINAVFAGIPSDILKKVNEYYYQSVFYFLLSVLGASDVVLERSGYIGKADATLVLRDKVYVIEFKFARKGTLGALLGSAFRQMNQKGYHLPFLGGNKPIRQIAIGLLFLTEKEGEMAKLKVEAKWKNVL
jgi:hypothetical protein